MRSSSLLPSFAGVASTHFKPIDLVSACNSWMRSFSGERKSDNSGKKLKIGSLMLPISPRSIAIPSTSDATLFETDFMSCSVSAIKGDVFHPAAVNAAGNLIGTPEVPFEQQLATACDQNRVHVSSAREPISHPAQRVAVDELVVIDGSDGPAVVPRDQTAAVGPVRVRRQRCAWRQRSTS